MTFTLTCKCPGCDRVTSHCTDTSLSANRVEYDAVRCKRCTRAGSPGRKPKRKLKLYGKPFWMLGNRNKAARWTRRMFTAVAMLLLVGCETARTMKPVGHGGPDTFEATNIYPWTMERRLDPRSVYVSKPDPIKLAIAKSSFVAAESMPAPAYDSNAVWLRIVSTNIPPYGKWFLVWAWHPAGERWSISASTDCKDWFTPPSYQDDGTNVWLTVASQKQMFFKAVKRR